MAGSCEHDDKLAGSIKCRECLEWLKNHAILKKGCVSLSQSVAFIYHKYKINAADHLYCT